MSGAEKVQRGIHRGELGRISNIPLLLLLLLLLLKWERMVVTMPYG